jgi:DNA-binding LacI/PurR family transcriptional regulator
VVLLLTGSKYVFSPSTTILPGALRESGTVKDVGLVLVNDGALPAYDRSIAALVHGLEERLLGRGIRVVTRLVQTSRAERAVYRTWSRTEAVGAVVLMDVRTGDPRVPLLRELGLPFVGVTDSARAGDFSAVTLDTRAMVETVLRFLVDRGYERAVYVRVPGGPTSDLGALRASTFTANTVPGIEVDLVVAGASPVDPVAAAVAASAGSARTATVFDDDASAVAAMALMRESGRRVPEDVAVFVWNDSPLCQTADPAISALNARADVVGDLVGDCLLRSADADHPVHLAAPAPFVVARASA